MPTASANSTASSDDSRPGLAIISNSVTPYRVNLHRLIADKIPEFKLHSLITHGDADFRWKVDLPASINIVHFGRAGDSPLASTFHAPLYEWQKGGRIIEYLRNHNVQAVLLNGYRYISYLRLMQHCHRHGIPAFVRSDSNIRSEGKLPPIKQFLKRRVYNWWIKRVSGVISMGRLGDEFFLKYGADPRRLYRVPCWPDFDAFARVDQVDLERFRGKYRLRPDKRYLIYSGRLVQVKRVDLLIDAFANIAARRPNWDLLIVGDGVLKSELRQRVPESLRPRVVWCGFLDREEPALAYHAADVLVLPSDREPWALVVQEAMAAGLVVVSSNISGAAYELIEDGRSGRIFPAGDVVALEEALLQVTADQAVEGLKQRSRQSLDNWRNSAYPITEIRRALTDVGAM